MKTETLEITPNCKFEATIYDSPYPPSISLEYVEHSTDYFYPDKNTSIELNKDEAQAIIDFLAKHFNIHHNPEVCQCNECRLVEWQVDQILGI